MRIGEKGSSGAPRSLDHFVCPDEEFTRLVGATPKQLTIRFPYADPSACFSSGLELWKRGKQRPILACYTKGSGVAHRLGTERGDDGQILLDPTQRERNDTPCAGFECEYYGKTGCRPVARLDFLLPGGPRDSVYRYETKSLNTIEALEGVLGQYRDCREYEFVLTVKRVKQGAKEFSIVEIAEAGGANMSAADVDRERAELIDLLAECGQDPRDPNVAAWVKANGYAACIDTLRRRLDG